MRTPLLLMTFLWFTNLYCKSSEEQLEDYLADSSRDTMTIDIPSGPGGRESNVYKYVKQMNDVLKIERIDSGYVPFQIRIWYHYGLIDTNHLFLIKSENEKWVAHWYTITFNTDSSRSDTTMNIVKDKIPRNGWATFVNRLFELRIDQLPDIDELPNVTDNSFPDPSGVVVEFAAINRYRLYSYYALDYFKDKLWQARNMEAILESIEEEFGFERLK